MMERPVAVAELPSPSEHRETPGLPGLAGKALRMRETGLILIILALFIAMSFASPYFLTWTNMRAMAMAFAVEGIVVVGMTILLISGGIDLSVGSVTALAMVIAGLLFLNGMDPWLASAIAIAACTAIGAIMGFFVTRVGLHHFIVSLAVMVIARGLCLLGTGGRPLGLYELPESFKFIGQGSIGVIPVVLVVFVVVVVVSDFMLRRTTMFRKVFYTGSNPKAAAYSGIDTRQVVFMTTTLCAALSGIAGIIYMARFGEPDAQLALLEAEDLCRTDATALLCFCGDEKKCHRHIIATALEAKGLKRKEIAFR